MKIKIERHRWHRGKGFHQSMSDGSKEIRTGKDPKAVIPNSNYECCVFGFAINSGEYKSFRDFALTNHGLVVNSKALDINDNPKLTDKQRESLLKQEFAKYNSEVEFVD